MITCVHCDDTHRMTLRDQVVPCTRCPTPCALCASHNGTGAYCAAPACPCGCHNPKRDKIADIVELAKSYLAGGISPPMREDTTPRIAKALANLADTVREYLDAREALRGCGYTRGCQTHAPCKRLDAARDALEAAVNRS